SSPPTVRRPLFPYTTLFRSTRDGSSSSAAARCWPSRSPRAPALPIAPDEVVRRAVVVELGLRRALELGDDALGEHLAQLDPPLIERVDVPDGALGEYAVLVERDELSECFRCEPLGQDRVRGTIALEHPMGDQA